MIAEYYPTVDIFYIIIDIDIDIIIINIIITMVYLQLSERYH